MAPPTASGSTTTITSATATISCPRYFALCAAGLEQGLVNELRAKFPGVAICGPFLKQTANNQDTDGIHCSSSGSSSDSIGSTSKTIVDDRCQVLRPDDVAACAVAPSARAEVSRVFLGEGVVIFDTDAPADDIVSKVMCARGVYAYLGQRWVGHVCQSEEALDSYLVDLLAMEEFEWRQAWCIWQTAAYCPAFEDKHWSREEILKAKATLTPLAVRGSGRDGGVTASTTTEAAAAATAATAATSGSSFPLPPLITDPFVAGVTRVKSKKKSVVTVRGTVVKRKSKSYPMLSQDMGGCFGAGVIRRFGWGVSLKRFHVNVFGFFCANQRNVFLGLALDDKEDINWRHRLEFGKTALQTYIASGLLWNASPEPGSVVLDPMCGTATIPIEGAADPGLTGIVFMGGDVHEPSLASATTNLEHTRASGDLVSPCTLFRWDSKRAPLRDASVDLIICDMPWGQRSGSAHQNRHLYPLLFREWARMMRPGARAYALTLSRPLTESSLRQVPPGSFHVEDIMEVDAGYLVQMYVLKRCGRRTAV